MKLEFLNCHPVVPAPATRPPLLFLHGSYCAAWVWEETFLPYFARAGYSAHAVSLRGHGGSDGPLALASLADYVADTQAAIAHLGQRCILIGHSMGGIVAQHCLSQDRGDVAALILMASVPPSGLGGPALSLLMSAPDLWVQFGLMQSLGPEAASAALIRRAFLSDQAPAAQVDRLLPRFQGESRRISVDLLAPPPPPRPSPTHPLPVLVIGGDQDPLVPVAALRESADYYRADLDILPGAPHGLMLDEAWWQPAADHILAWLAARGF